MNPADLALWSARAAGTLAGLALLYAAFFLYPDERRTLHSRLESWWVRLDDARLSARSREPVLIRRLAETTRSGFEGFFGDPLSKRFFVISGLLSMLSFALALSTFGDYGWAVPSGLLVFAFATGWAVLQFGVVSDRIDQEWRRQSEERFTHLESVRVLASDQDLSGMESGDHHLSASAFLRQYGITPPRNYPVARERPWWDNLTEQIPTYALMILATTSTGLVLAGAQERGVGTGPFLFAILTAFVCDVASILVTMALLDRLARTRNAFTAAGWLGLDAVAASAMLAIPLGLYLFVVDRANPIGSFLAFLASANVSTALPSTAYLLLALGLLLHRLLWPILLRPFYNLVHAERLRHPKTLGTLGLALLVASWPQVLAPFEPLVETILDLV